MKWSLDTHKFLSEIVRTALKTVVNHHITPESDDTVIKATEHELADKGVYRSKEAAEGRIRRALLTYFKAYNLMSSNGELTELGTLFYKDKLSVKELCLHFLYSYKYVDKTTEYYPLEVILSFVDYCRKTTPSNNFISLQDFDGLVKCENYNDAAFSQIIANRGSSANIDARSIGYDVWSYMLIESGLFEKNEDKSLRPTKSDITAFLLKSYKSSKQKCSESSLQGGYISLIPKPNCNKRMVKQCPILESKAIAAFLFDGIAPDTINKFICPVGGSITAMLQNYGLDISAQAAFKSFSGYEHLVGAAWSYSQDPLVHGLGSLIKNMAIGVVASNILAEGPIESSTIRLSPQWFSQMAQQFTSADIESEQLYKDFRAKYSPEALKAVEGTDLLHKIFINETRDRENLCYVLEFDKQFNQFGGIGGGSAYKYGLYYNADKQSWMTGSSRNPRTLSVADAISLGTTIRNEILAGVKIIEDAGELTELKDYAELNTKLYETMPTTINKKWVIKYFHMLFPQLFPPFYNDEWQKKVLTAIDEEPDGNSFIRMGQIALFVKKCGISTLAFSKVIYNLNSLGEIEDAEDTVVANEQFTFDSEITNGKNIVVYGTPGCGKSFYVQNKLLGAFGVANDEQHRIRTTFYQDYTNTDFVGQIIPKVKEDKSVTYEFNPGPFALALKMAIERPNESVALIIEELNRGNAASIFGDIFQLLDRTDDGKSQYRITNVNLQDYLNKVFKDRNIHFDYIVIPSNLHIVATMNTSDQNVFTLDTAFKRRWKFEKLPNIFTDDHEYAGYYVPGMEGITWKKLVKSINDYIVSRADELSSEDKQLGIYFIGKETLSKTQEGTTDAAKKKEFAYKLLEYLWDDVAKYNHSDWFGPDVKTLDQLIEDYMTKGQEVFVDGILK